MAKVKGYYSDNALSVQFYDLITSLDPHIKGDVEFYCSLLPSPPRGALELGCGTGRVALALAARGYKVVGLDSSEPMLARARAKCRSLPGLLHRSASFIKGDMTTFDIALRFDLIAVPYYSFNHLRGRVPRARCLEMIAKHLARGSHAVIHASSPEMFLERRGTRETTFRFNNAEYDRLEVTWHEAVVHETERSFEQIIEYRLFGNTGAAISASAERLNLWWFDDNELLFSARKAGSLTSFGPEQGRSRIYVLKKGLRSPD